MSKKIVFIESGLLYAALAGISMVDEKETPLAIMSLDILAKSLGVERPSGPPGQACYKLWLKLSGKHACLFWLGNAENGKNVIVGGKILPVVGTLTPQRIQYMRSKKYVLSAIMVKEMS